MRICIEVKHCSSERVRGIKNAIILRLISCCLIVGTSTETLLVLNVEKMYSLQHRTHNVGWYKYQQGVQCVSITGGSTQRDKSSLIYYHNRPTTLGRDKQFFSSVMYLITVFFFLNYALDSIPFVLYLFFVWCLTLAKNVFIDIIVRAHRFMKHVFVNACQNCSAVCALPTD